MHRILLTALLAAFALPVAAQTIAASESHSASSSQSASGSQSNNANNVNIISSAPELQRVEGSYASREAVNVTGQQHIKTNTAVGLAAAVSFSSDYCGGTAGVGASAAGITLGGNKPVFDENCQLLRRAEKLGMAAVNAQNLGMREDAAKLQRLVVWQLCLADPLTTDGCLHLGLVTREQLADADKTLPVR